MIDGGEQEDCRKERMRLVHARLRNKAKSPSKTARFHFSVLCIFAILFAVPETSRTVTGDFHTLTNTRGAL